ncbi:MAG: hypothetical protein VB977_07215 [Pseudohongiellaceae bacterium]|mgnify:FL=1|tara:strand:- start:1353 stop:2318 length:966 start_codon:yes stop_codon:yes gene_type:complete
MSRNPIATRHVFPALTAALMLAFCAGFTLQAAAQIEQLPYQLRYHSGQTIQPIFQGWSRNDDGSFDMHFGYLNRNYIEELNVPIGADNFIDMAGLDQIQRQPTYFHPRSNRDIFTVTVPADFGDREIVWSLNTQGKSLQAIGWLQSEWEIDEYGGREPDAETLANQPPEITVSTASSVTLLATLRLTAMVTDDGLPKPEPEPTEEERRQKEAAVLRPTQARPPMLTPPEDALEIPVNVPQLTLSVRGNRISARPPSGKLTVSYMVWRGPGNITTDPQFAEVENNSATTYISFSKPGEYELQVRAYDGGKSSYEFVTVNVRK